MANTMGSASAASGRGGSVRHVSTRALRVVLMVSLFVMVLVLLAAVFMARGFGAIG